MAQTAELSDEDRREYQGEADAYNELPDVLKPPGQEKITIKEVAQRHNERAKLIEALSEASPEKQVNMILDPLRELTRSYWDSVKVMQLAEMSGDDLFSSPEARSVVTERLVYSLRNENIDDALGIVQRLEVPMEVASSPKVKEAYRKKIVAVANGETRTRDNLEMLGVYMDRFGMTEEDVEGINIPDEKKKELLRRAR